MSEGDTPKLTFMFREGSGLAKAAEAMANMTPEELAWHEQLAREFTSPVHPWDVAPDPEAFRAAWVKAFGGLPDISELDAAWRRAGEDEDY